jgi:hypothetical protein
MNIERFRATLDLMTELDRTLKIQTWLEQIRDSLINLANAPAQPPQQTALANALSSLTTASEQLAARVTPQQFRLIDELGGSPYFDPNLAKQLKAEIAANAMTPTVPRDVVQRLSSERANFIATLNNTINGLDSLGIKGEVLEPGTADVSFAIPGELFENNLGSFAKELIFIDRLMRDLGEALTGNSEAIHLESLNSSTPTVAVTAGIKVLASLADLVSKFLTAWDKVVKYREARETLTQLGLSVKAIEEVSDQINTTIEEVVEESVEFILAEYSADNGRKNELSNALTQDTRRLFGQIERGLTIQFRTGPEKEADEDDEAALSTIHEAAQKLSFPPVQSEPMLLANGVIVEGDVPIFKYTKKTTSKRTTKTTGN